MESPEKSNLFFYEKPLKQYITGYLLAILPSFMDLINIHPFFHLIISSYLLNTTRSLPYTVIQTQHV